MTKRAGELGYDMIAVPEHFVVPNTHLELSGPLIGEGLGVTMSSVPIPPVRGVDEYLDSAQWVIEEIKPKVP